MDFTVCRDTSDSLCHYGIKGQKWGVRRFQNSDRTWTEEGKERYDDTPNDREPTKKKSVSLKESGPVPRKESASAEISRRNNNQKEKAEKELTPEELAERSEKRKATAKKVAIGVGIAAAAVGAAFVAKYAHDRAANLKAVDSAVKFDVEDFERRLKESTERKTGTAGAVQRVIEGVQGDASKRLMEDAASDKISRETRLNYSMFNTAVDKLLARSVYEGNLDQINLDNLDRQDVAFRTTSNLRRDAEKRMQSLLDSQGDNLQMKYLNDTAIEFIRANPQITRQPAKKYIDVSNMDPFEVYGIPDSIRDIFKKKGWVSA